MIELTSKQRRNLEKIAHNIDPVVIVGAAGVTDGVINMVQESLAVHELIKVKFNEYKDERFELTSKICNDTGAALVRIIGNKAILYKQAEEPENRKIKI